jgi:ABC-type uncharacterized transport system substrate-binding protein
MPSIKNFCQLPKSPAYVKILFMLSVFKKTACMLLFALTFPMASAEVSAHPHVWIDSTIEFVFSAQQVAGVRVTYLFDEMYSLTMINQYDQDGNGLFSPKEERRLKKTVL